MAQISCKDLAIGYDSRIIVDNLNFEVNTGDYLCIVGENGAGKSTLMKTLLNLQNPVRGTITTGDGLRVGEIGYLSQQTAIQRDFPASVREIVLSGCQVKSGLRPFYNSAEKKLAEENMEKMGVLSMAKRSYRELSGGQQQRVAMIRALVQPFDFIIVDEPISHLDDTNAEIMGHIMMNEAKAQGAGVIVTSIGKHMNLNYERTFKL